MHLTLERDGRVCDSDKSMIELEEGMTKWSGKVDRKVRSRRFLTSVEVAEYWSLKHMVSYGKEPHNPFAGLAASCGLLIMTRASYENSLGRTAGFVVEDEEVWFARFMPVTIESNSEQGEELPTRKNKVLPKTIKRIELQEIEDLALEGIRSAAREIVDPVSDFESGLTGHVTIQDHETTSE